MPKHEDGTEPNPDYGLVLTVLMSSKDDPDLYWDVISTASNNYNSAVWERILAKVDPVATPFLTLRNKVDDLIGQGKSIRAILQSRPGDPSNQDRLDLVTLTNTVITLLRNL